MTCVRVGIGYELTSVRDGMGTSWCCVRVDLGTSWQGSRCELPVPTQGCGGGEVWVSGAPVNISEGGGGPLSVDHPGIKLTLCPKIHTFPNHLRMP